MENVNYEQLWVTCVFPDFFLDKIGNIKDCSARKIVGLNGMPGKHLEQKNANKKR